MRLWALVTSALRMMKVSPCVGGCHVRGSPLLPPNRSVPRGVGGNGAYQGPGHLGVAPSLRVLTAVGGLHHPPAPMRAGWCCGGPSQGPRHLGTAPALAGEHPEVSHQCPRMGLGVDEDGPPLS